MKKLLIFTASLCFVLTSIGQKQQTDDKTLEVNFSPLGGNPISINGIKMRKFTDDYNALRLEVFLGLNNSKTVSMQEGANTAGAPEGSVVLDNPNPLTYSKTGGFDFSIRPGFEKHFNGTARLSPYVGAAVNLGFSSSSSTEEYWSTNELVVPTDADDFFNNHVEWEQKTKDGSINLGLSALAGMDFYFADNIYLGFEFGFGLGFTSMSSTKYTSTDDNAWAISSLDPTMDTNFGGGTFELDDDGEIESVSVRDDEKNGSTFNLGPIVNGALRLGFTFN